MDRLQLKWDKLVGFTTAGCLNLTGKCRTFDADTIEDKRTEVNPEIGIV